MRSKLWILRLYAVHTIAVMLFVSKSVSSFFHFSFTSLPVMFFYMVKLQFSSAKVAGIAY